MPPQVARQVVLAALLLAAVALLAPALLPWAALGVLAWLAARWLRRPERGVVGQVAVARTDLDPRGEVLLGGVPRAAEAYEPVVAGERVRVLADVDGVLRVAPLGVWSGGAGGKP